MFDKSSYSYKHRSHIIYYNYTSETLNMILYTFNILYINKNIHQ